MPRATQNTRPLPPQNSRFDRIRNLGRKKTVYRPVAQGRRRNTINTAFKRIKQWRPPKVPEGITRIASSWWLEILGSLLVILSFSGLVAILHDYQGKPQPNWPLGFSFNTALSVLGALFRAPALFIVAEGVGQLKWLWLSNKRPLSDLSAYDEATRGPWGATRLLWVARWRDIFAFLGALIIIASLGLDPFTQAVVSYYPCIGSDYHATSSISHINSFFSQAVGYNLPTWALLAMDASFTDPTSIKPKFTCTASTCSFLDSYHTVGICSRCVDVSTELHTNCTAGIRGGCSYTLSVPYPGNVTVNTTAGYTISPAVGGKVDDLTYANWQVFSVQKFKSIMSPEGVMVPLGTNGTSPHHQSSSIDLVSAWPVLGCRCHLYYCIRTYTATIEHGVLHETLQSTSANWSSYTKETPVLGTVRVSCLKPEIQAYLLNSGYIAAGTQWMPWNGTYLNGTEAQEHISQALDPVIPVNCVYQIQILSSGLNWTPEEVFSDPLTGSLNGTGFNKNIRLAPSSRSLLAGLYNNGTLSVESLGRAFDNFTTAATNYMRLGTATIPRNITSLLPTNINTPVALNPVPGKAEDWNHPVTGKAFIDTTCIHVRWPWLALPAAIFVGTLILFAMLIFKTAHDRELEVWKSSQNALIWHGIDGSAELESVTLITKKQMDVRSKEINVRLKKTGMGWKLVQDG
jgi:hypothetical protein